MSALITLVIVVMWGVVLVPMWLRRQERSNELSSVSRFSGAMRVLSRRVPVEQTRSVVMPSRPAAVRRPVTAGVRTPRAGVRRPGTGGRRTPASRRQRTLTGLCGLCLVTALLVLVSPGLGVLAQLGSDVLLAAGVVRTRRLVVAERRRAAVARRRSATLRRDLDALAACAPAVPRRERLPAPQETPFAPGVESAGEPGLDSAAGPRDGAGGPARAATTEARLPAAGSPGRPTDSALDGAGGHPAASRHRDRPFPAPVTAELTAGPRVPAPRVVDLTRPGLWSALQGGLVEPVPAGQDFDAFDPHELEFILDRRRAVNE